MQKRKPYFLFLPFLLLLVAFLVPSALANSPSCMKQVLLLEKQKDDSLEGDGLWSLFEKSPVLRGHSIQAIKLDGIINETIVNLKYLCETANGVPLNELAVYVSQNIRKKGENEFREELKRYGKSKEKIEIWFEFAKSAQINLKRTLNSSSIQKTIHHAADYIEKYIAIAQPSNPRLTALPTQAKELIGKIKLFFSGDPNMAVAIDEIAQIPYWDIDENYGGS